MPALLDERAVELVRAPNFCHVSTLRADGTILTVPVWVDTDGQHLLLNTAEGRAWPENARREGTVTCTVQNLDDPYEYVSITGTLVEEVHEGAVEHIHALEKRYRGNDRYPLPEGQRRVILKVRPERIYHRRPS